MQNSTLHPHPKHRTLLYSCAILQVLCNQAIGELSPAPVHTPEEQMHTFVFAESGYRMEPVAWEPMVQEPVALTFDGEGRLWVVEMRGFMHDVHRSGVKNPTGRVSVLVDTDKDGVMDESTVFAEGLVLPRAIAVLPDGVLIAEHQPLWFMEDLDGDLIADRKTLIDPHYAKDLVEHSANGLYRAMDNWIYNAKEGHRYRRQNGVWIRAETEERGQWGICQDDQGRLFYNYNHSQLHSDLVPPNALTRNPNHQPSTGLSIGVTDSNRVYPIRPTPAVNRGYIPGVLDDKDRIKQFTSACAPFIYRGNLFPAFRENAFVCEPAGNLIKRSVLTYEGLRVTGTSPYDDRDFLASTDERFRPCWLATGPDSAIYIADMYRGIIQDGIYMSPYLRDQIESRRLDKPIHLGRIWRIVPDDFQQPDPPRFSNMSVEELVAALSHPSGWWRDRAQTHLVERQLKSATPALREMALHHANPTARLHALWSLEGIGYAEPDRLLPALRDDLPIVRTAAIRVLISLGMDGAQMAELIESSEEDPVVLQWILALGDLSMDDSKRLRKIYELLAPRALDSLMRDAALSSLAGRELEFLNLVLDSTSKEFAPGMAYLIESLSAAIIRSRDSQAIRELIDKLEFEAPWKQKSIWNGITIFGPILTQRPVKLPAAPAALETHPQLQQYFAWPGHTPPAPENETDFRPLTEREAKQYALGRQIYLSTCAACHGSDGRGMKNVAPPLADSDWVQGEAKRLIRILLHGLTGPIKVSGKRYAPPEIQPDMPPLGMLGNDDISAVLTYIRREWENTADPVSPRTVSQLRIQTQGRTTPWTQSELESVEEKQSL